MWGTFGKHHPVQECESAECSLCCQERRREKWSLRVLEEVPRTCNKKWCLQWFLWNCSARQNSHLLVLAGPLYFTVQWIYCSCVFAGSVYVMFLCIWLFSVLYGSVYFMVQSIVWSVCVFEDSVYLMVHCVWWFIVFNGPLYIMHGPMYLMVCYI